MREFIATATLLFYLVLKKKSYLQNMVESENQQVSPEGRSRRWRSTRRHWVIGRSPWQWRGCTPRQQQFRQTPEIQLRGMERLKRYLLYTHHASHDSLRVLLREETWETKQAALQDCTASYIHDKNQNIEDQSYNHVHNERKYRSWWRWWSWWP